MAYANGPDRERYRWFSCVIGKYIIPTNPTTGAVVVQATSSAKDDKKKGAGKNKSKATHQGKEDTKITIEWEFTAADWADGASGVGVETILEYLDPNSDGEGGPFDFAHPDTDRRKVEAIKIDKIGPVVWKGWHGSVKIDGKEWTDPDAKGNAGAGGTATKTPAAPDKWNDGGGRDANWTGANQSGPKAPFDETKKGPNADPS